MSLIKWDPFKEIDDLRRDVGAFLWGWPLKFLGGYGYFQPRVDVYTTDKDVKITAELPGLESKDDVEVYVTDDAVRLKGEYKNTSEYKEDDVYRSERYFGSFVRVIPLPCKVKSEQATATYRNGLLNITIPKSETDLPKGRRIDIH